MEKDGSLGSALPSPPLGKYELPAVGGVPAFPAPEGVEVSKPTGVTFACPVLASPVPASTNISSIESPMQKEGDAITGGPTVSIRGALTLW